MPFSCKRTKYGKGCAFFCNIMLFFINLKIGVYNKNTILNKPIVLRPNCIIFAPIKN